MSKSKKKNVKVRDLNPKKDAKGGKAVQGTFATGTGKVIQGTSQTGGQVSNT